MTAPLRARRAPAAPVLSYVVLASALLAGAGPAAWAQGQGAIRGQVSERDGRAAVPSAQIVVRGGLGIVVGSALSAEGGGYVVTGLPPGVYAVEAGRLGYGQQSVAGIVVAPRDTATVNFALTPVPLQAEAIVVTTTRRVERVADADASVAVVPGALVQHANESTVFGSLKSVRGIDYFASGLGQQQVNARGFVNPFTSNLLFLIDNRLSTLPGLGTVLPGMILATQGDVAQVEVVTGPTSALYGANAGNGVVNLVTRDPREAGGNALSVTLGERDLVRLSARSSGLLGSRLGFKLSAEDYRVRDFQRVNTFAGAGGFTIQDQPDFDVRNQSLTGALYLYPGTGNRVVYAGGFTRAKYVNLTVVSRLQADHWDSWYQQLRGNFANVLGLGSFFVQGYYTRNDAGDSYYLDILARSQIPVAAGGPGLTPDAAMQRARFVDKSDRIDVEVQHSAHIGGHHFVTSGVQWREIRPVSEGTYLTDGPTDPGIQIDEGGGYVAYDNTMLPRVRVTAVGRFDTHSDLGSRFSPRLSVSYTPVAAHLLRASYSRAFNSPTTYLLYARSFVGRTAAGQNIFVRGNRAGWSFVNTAGGTVPDRLEPLTPLNVESVEAGYRGALGDRVFLDATVYRTVYWNYISKESDISRPPDSVFALDPASGQILRELTRTYLNYGELPVLGADLGVQLALDRFSVSGSASWQRPGTFRKPVAGLAPPAFNAPEWKYKVSGAWRGWAGPESYLEVSGVRVNQFFFQSSLPYLTGTVPTYHVLDLDAGAALPRWGFARTRLAVSVKNLLDEAHIEVPGGAELGRVASVGITVEW